MGWTIQYNEAGLLGLAVFFRLVQQCRNDSQELLRSIPEITQVRGCLGYIASDRWIWKEGFVGGGEWIYVGGTNERLGGGGGKALHFSSAVRGLESSTCDFSAGYSKSWRLG